jgi:cell division protein FtsQ
VVGTETSALSELSERPKRGFLQRRPTNRRVAVQRQHAVLVVAKGVSALGRALWAALRVLSKVVLTLAVLAAILVGGRLAVQHVIASPRFAVRDVQVPPLAHLDRDEVLSLAEVEEGDRLLRIDTDAVAAKVAAHPWVASVRVRRQLPATLAIEITERRAVGVVALGALYLIDDVGHPFKRATLDEADGLPVITGVDRAQYAAVKDAAEAAFREALALLEEYGRERPVVSELNIDSTYGFTLFLRDSGAEIRLGREEFSKKLARLDQIFEAVRTSSTGAVRVVHLDYPSGAGGTRISVGLAQDQKEKKD